MLATRINIRQSLSTQMTARLLLTLSLGVGLISAASANPLVNFADASRNGLERAWFAQIRVDSARHQVANWLLEGDQLFAITTDGTVHALDAETGQTLWVAEVGVGSGVPTGIAANDEFVALLTATRLHIHDHRDGRRIWSRRLGGAPSAAPTMSRRYAYVAMLSGRVEGFNLDDPTATVWQYQSAGRVFQSPTATGNVVSWPTDRGYLYVGQADSPRVLFRVKTNEEIVAPPAEREPYLYVASLDGYLYCFDESTGSETWRYATGFAITSTPAIVGDNVFVASEGPTLHAVHATSGRPLWRVDGAAQFVALGAKRAYGMDAYGTLLILDPETGGIVGRLATSQGTSAIVNEQTDRIFLTDSRGLIQCLHEIGAVEPTSHRAPADADEAAAEETSADEPSPTAATEEPGADADTPRQPAEEAEPADDEDPFGGANPFEF